VQGVKGGAPGSRHSSEAAHAACKTNRRKRGRTQEGRVPLRDRRRAPRCPAARRKPSRGRSSSAPRPSRPRAQQAGDASTPTPPREKYGYSSVTFCSPRKPPNAAAKREAPHERQRGRQISPPRERRVATPRPALPGTTVARATCTRPSAYPFTSAATQRMAERMADAATSACSVYLVAESSRDRNAVLPAEATPPTAPR